MTKNCIKEAKSMNYRATASSPEALVWRHTVSPIMIGVLEVARAWGSGNVTEVTHGHYLAVP